MSVNDTSVLAILAEAFVWVALFSLCHLTGRLLALMKTDKRRSGGISCVWGWGVKLGLIASMIKSLKERFVAPRPATASTQDPLRSKTHLLVKLRDKLAPCPGCQQTQESGFLSQTQIKSHDVHDWKKCNLWPNATEILEMNSFYQY